MSRWRTGLTALRLARWLGPWADEAAIPEVPRREVVVPGSPPTRAWVYAAPGARGAVMVVPGLHYLGPADPRLDRFCRVLAAAGLWVYAPFLPDFLALRLDPQVIDDTARAFDACLAHPDRPPGRPGVLSISFGSLPALRLAAARGDALGGLLCFGGYADWRAVLRFCLAGDGGSAHDPLNRPVVFLALRPHLADAPADSAPLAAAWRAFVEATWGRPEMKAEATFTPVARRLAHTLPEAQRRLFLQGCGVAPRGAGGGRGGPGPRARSALARSPPPPRGDHLPGRVRSRRGRRRDPPHRVGRALRGAPRGAGVAHRALWAHRASAGRRRARRGPGNARHPGGHRPPPGLSERVDASSLPGHRSGDS